MIGVYKITNTVNGKVYIGSTTIGFKNRWATHRNELRNRRHCNKHLQRAWNKYGENAFSFEVLETATSKADARQKELSWIARFFGKNCYNSTKQAAGRPGKYEIDEICGYAKKAISEGSGSTTQVIEYLKINFGISVSQRFIGKVFKEIGHKPREWFAERTRIMLEEGFEVITTSGKRIWVDGSKSREKERIVS